MIDIEDCKTCGMFKYKLSDSLVCLECLKDKFKTTIDFDKIPELVLSVRHIKDGIK